MNSRRLLPRIAAAALAVSSLAAACSSEPTTTVLDNPTLGQRTIDASAGPGVSEEPAPDTLGMTEPTPDPTSEPQTGFTLDLGVDAELDSGLERTSVDGVVVTAKETLFDYGNGPEDAVEVLGDHPDGTAGVYFSHDLVADTTSLDTIGWAGSGGTFVVLVEVGPDVNEVRLTNSVGVVDAVAPTAERLAVLGIRTEDPGTVRIEALDATGALIGTCQTENTTIVCRPA